MGPQPPSLPHTGASRRARRSTFSAARFSAAPDTETRFPCLQTRSGAQKTGDRAQARLKAPEGPERSVFLATGTRSGEDGVTGNLVRPGVGVIGAWFAAGYGLYGGSPPQSATRNVLHRANR